MTPLILATGAMGLGQSVLFMLVPLLAEHTGLQPWRLTLALAVGTLMFLVGAPRLGRASDRFGRRPVLAAAVGGYLASSLLLAAVVVAAAAGILGPEAAFVLLLASRVAHGLTASGILPVAQAWIADVTAPEERLPRFARLSAGASIGRALGPALGAGALLLHPLGPLVLMVLAPLPGLFALTSRSGGGRPRPAAGSARLRWGDGRIARLLATGWTTHTALGLMLYTIGLLMQERLGLSGEAAAGVLGGLMTAGAVVTAVVQAGVARRRPAARTLLLAGAGALTAGALAVALAHDAVAFGAGFALTGAAAALLLPSYVSSASRAVEPHEQGAASGMLSASHTLGYAAGALLGGTAFELHPAGPFLLAAALATSLPALALKPINAIATR